MRRQFNVPIQEGGEYDVTIEAVGEKGDGIAKIGGFVIFVPGTQAGQRVKVKVEKVLRKFAIGKVVGEGAPAEDVKVEEAPEEMPEETAEETPEEETEEAPEEETPEEETEEAAEEAPEQEEASEEA